MYGLWPHGYCICIPYIFCSFHCMKIHKKLHHLILHYADYLRKPKNGNNQQQSPKHPTQLHFYSSLLNAVRPFTIFNLNSMAPVNNTTGNGADANTDPAFLRIKETLLQGGIKIQQQIGTGTHSRVHQAVATIDGTPNTMVAIKLIDKRAKGEYIERFMERELNIIKRLAHPNIVRVWGIFRTPEFVAINEEYAANGDLLHHIRTREAKYLVEHEAQFLFRQLMEAIIYLERQYILHRDLKCENIFLDRCFNVKLGDFGFTRQLRPGEHSNTHCGSKPYAALELLTGQTYHGNSVDIWSAGVCCYVMMTGRFPYGSGHDDVKSIIQKQRLKSIKFPSRMSENAMQIILRMVEPQIARRATTKEILAHPWLAATKYQMKTV